MSYLFSFFLLIFGMKSKKRKSKSNKSIYSHEKKIEHSKTRLKTLDEIGVKGGIPSQLNYLRKIDPFVFEEMILSAIEQKSHCVIRNSRYTGDGGLDGAFEINGKKYFIQAKRFSGYIRASDVLEFANLCKSFNAKGIFVHTGKTGAEAKAAAGSTVEIVSGAKLISLLIQNKKAA